MSPDLLCILLDRCPAEVHRRFESMQPETIAYTDDIEVSIVRLTQELSPSFKLSLPP